MSNLERDPRETVCGGLATVSAEPTRRVLAPREVPLGGPRAMTVRRTLPHRELRTIGAWCFVDDYGPDLVAGTAGMHVPPHPHTGLQTVTWLLEGEVSHEDSLGSQALVRPGELSLMTAGRGISHAETSPIRHSPRLRGVQLWVALPDAERHGDPGFAHHADLPVLEDADLSATVIVGTLAGATSPARVHTPLIGAELSLRPVAAEWLPLEDDFEHGVLALTGGLTVDGAEVPAGAMVYLGCGRSDVALGAGAAGARLLLLGGTPLEEELLMWWNFVGRSHEEIEESRAEWEQARTGHDTRFGVVRGYDGPALPAPPLPGSRLKPRPRQPGG